MLLTILLIMFAVGMLVQGASAVEVATACGLMLALAWGRPRLERWVELCTGRTSMTPSEPYRGASLIVGILIALPPIYFLPGAHWLVISSFTLLAMCVSGPIAQACFGKRAT